MALKLESEGGQDAALAFCKHFLQIVRLVKLYEVDNVNLQDPLTKFQQVVIAVADRMGSARLQADEGMLYFNKDPVRGGRRAFGIIQGTDKALEDLGVAEIAFMGAVSVPELRTFFGFLKRPDGVRELDVDGVKEKLKSAQLSDRIAVYMPGETTGAAQIQQVDIDEKTYFPLAYARTLVLLREYVKNLKSEELNRYFTTKLHRALQELVRLISKYEHKFLQMAAVRDVDDYLFNHMANVGVLSMVLGHRLGISRVKLSNLALGGMLHALGRFRSARALWERTELGPNEMAALGKHPYRALGAILEGRKITRKTLVSCATSFQWDLHRGVTALRGAPEKHPFAMIVRVCEEYDSLTSNHPDRTALTPDQALRKMVEAPAGHYDELVLTVFTNMMGLFPTGTTVSLSSGEIAVVVHPNPEKPKRPLVAIVMGADGVMLDGDFLDLAEKIHGKYPCEITGSVDPNELGINVPDYLLAYETAMAAREVIILDPDPEGRLLVRSVLERDGFRVQEASDPNMAVDVLRASHATAIIIAPSLTQQNPGLADDIAALQPNLDVLTPANYGEALLDGAAEGSGLSEFARDALLLLGILAEDGAKTKVGAERLGRMTELTALRMDMSRYQIDACSAAAALVALGPSLVAFRFGVDPTLGAQGGVSHDLQASMAALSALRCPYDLKTVVEAVDEQFDGRGRPRGLAGDQIPIGARVIAVTREYCKLVAEGTDAMAATELIRARMNSAFDPKVIEAFFGALRDETYVDRLEGGQTGAKILIIDGDPSSLAVTEMRLGAAGFQVTTAADGARGFEMICNDRPDLVVADTVLPKLDGISLLLKMRRMPEVKGIPVVFVSTRTEQGLLNKALKLGAKDVLAKPVNYQILLAKVRALSSMKQGQAQQQGSAAQGNLQDMPLTDFFRVISIGRKTCKVSVSSPAGKAEIFFEQGSPVAAYTANERGREAFASVVTWTEGAFGMTIGETAPEHNLDRGLETLIMQGGFQ